MSLNSLHLSKKQLNRSFMASTGGITFRLNPLILTASRTFNNLFRWSLFICLNIFSYQSSSRGGSFIFLAIFYSKDYFTGNWLLMFIFFLGFITPPSNLFNCLFSWKSRNANFFVLLPSLFSGKDGSSISYLKNQFLLSSFLTASGTSSPTKYLLLMSKWDRTGS